MLRGDRRKAVLFCGAPFRAADLVLCPAADLNPERDNVRFREMT